MSKVNFGDFPDGGFVADSIMEGCGHSGQLVWLYQFILRYEKCKLDRLILCVEIKFNDYLYTFKHLGNAPPFQITFYNTFMNGPYQ